MFWEVMSGILGEPAPVQYAMRVDYLQRHGIALWDVLHAAEREGSLDANNQNGEFNDIASLIMETPSIEVIAINGGKAEKNFRKYLRKYPSLASKRICFCTSTSSMSLCSGWNLERIIAQWRGIL